MSTERNERRIALLDQAVELIKGVPDETLNLSNWGYNNDDGCGTIGCAAGWLTHFRFGGLKLNGGYDWTPIFETDGRVFFAYAALCEVFDIESDYVVDLFYPRSGKDQVEGRTGTDKQVWLARAEKVRSEMVAGTLPFYDGEME